MSILSGALHQYAVMRNGPLNLRSLLSEPHLHLGAALPFEVLWTNAMAGLGSDGLTARAVSEAGLQAMNPTESLLDWLVSAALLRILLARYLWIRERGAPLEVELMVESLPLDGRDRNGIRAVLSSFARGDGPLPAVVVRPILRRLVGSSRSLRRARGLVEMRASDPFSSWLGIDGPAWPETRFLTRAIRSLSQGTATAAFESLFWQYVRIRGWTYRQITQDAGTDGLQWFQRHFRKISILRLGMSPRVRMEAAISLESRGARLLSLEVRAGPDAEWPKIRDLARAVARAGYDGGSAQERGLVLHFQKEEGTPGGSAAGDPRQRPYNCRFGATYDRYRREATAISRALRFHPELTKVVRGLDVCGIELSVPNWVIFPIFRRLRDESRLRAARRPGRSNALRLTVHVGEEFRHLAEGLRRIHEGVLFAVLEAGDRLGHALALGTDVDRWAGRHETVFQPAEERLDDLLWELSLYRAVRVRASGSRIEVVRARIATLSEWIYGRSLPPEDLIRAWELRHETATLARFGFPFVRPGPTAGGPLEIVWRYLTDTGVYERGILPVRVAVDAEERSALKGLQAAVQASVAELGLVVEANLSSNLLIGDHAFAEHPIFRFQPLPGATSDAAGVPVVLGDDDPLTFAANLSEEYAHVYYALLRNGSTAREALVWLEEVRSNAWDARFTLPSRQERRPL